jgi:hypothetical protein
MPTTPHLEPSQPPSLDPVPPGPGPTPAQPDPPLDPPEPSPSPRVPGIGPLPVIPSDKAERPDGLAFDVEPGADLTGVPVGDQAPSHPGAERTQATVKESGMA